ncbi:MAG: transketolase C-terminal domain-containing protein [Gammaproteobacteria bacterium]
MQTMTYREAIVAAQRDALSRNPDIIIMGEDIGAAGSPFKTTQGLFEEFGGDRVRDTPISENAFVGAALGMAITGYRPIVELMFSDFMGVCFDQIVNNIAKHRFMCGGSVEVPLVIRAMGGGGVRFGAQHSQTGETWLFPFPGLKVYCSATPSDAFHMLRSAVADKNPVVVLEHKGLMASSGEVDVNADSDSHVTGPEILREGEHVTIVASLGMVNRCLEAAEKLNEEGISAEVINIRVLRPLNTGPILESMKKTGSILVVEENHQCGGWGAEVISQMIAEGFDYIETPPRRVTLPDWPMPYSPPLEDAAIPSVDKVVETVRDMV